MSAIALFVFSKESLIFLLLSSIVILIAIAAIHKKVRTFSTLRRVVCLVPPYGLRERIKTLISKQAHHAGSLRKAGRYHAACWIELATWIMVLWAILLAPLSALVAATRGTPKL